MKFLDNLSLTELESLRYYFVNDDTAAKSLIEEIDRKISFKKNIDFGLMDFSSDRMPNYREENESRCIELLNEIKLNELDFLVSSMSRDAKGVNAMSCLPLTRIDKDLKWDDCTLLSLETFFKDHYQIESHEGVYNTFNYIKNYIYYLLMNSSSLDRDGVFALYDDKFKMVSEQLADIASYLYEMRNDASELKLSIGNAGLYNTTRRVDNSKPLSRFQRRFADAIAFGISYDKLEKRDYEECKRLLFVERNRRKR